jgi:hypothetical protein
MGCMLDQLPPQIAGGGGGVASAGCYLLTLPLRPTTAFPGTSVGHMLTSVLQAQAQQQQVHQFSVPQELCAGLSQEGRHIVNLIGIK